MSLRPPPRTRACSGAGILDEELRAGLCLRPPAEGRQRFPRDSASEQSRPHRQTGARGSGLGQAAQDGPAPACALALHSMSSHPAPRPPPPAAPVPAPALVS